MAVRKTIISSLLLLLITPAKIIGMPEDEPAPENPCAARLNREGHRIRLRPILIEFLADVDRADEKWGKDRADSSIMLMMQAVGLSEIEQRDLYDATNHPVVRMTLLLRFPNSVEDPISAMRQTACSVLSSYRNQAVQDLRIRMAITQLHYYAEFDDLLVLREFSKVVKDPLLRHLTLRMIQRIEKEQGMSANSAPVSIEDTGLGESLIAKMESLPMDTTEVQERDFLREIRRWEKYVTIEDYWELIEIAWRLAKPRVALAMAVSEDPPFSAHEEQRKNLKLPRETRDNLLSACREALAKYISDSATPKANVLTFLGRHGSRTDLINLRKAQEKNDADLQSPIKQAISAIESR